jgi:hypothetical protein
LVNVEFIPIKPANITGIATPCSNSSYTYFIPKIPNATNYVWSFPAGWAILNSSDTLITTKTSLLSGDITVKATNGCGVGVPNSLLASVQIIPNKPVIQNPKDTLCSGYSYLIYSDSVIYATNYEWLFPAGWNILSGHGTNSTNITTGNKGGIIKVVEKNGLCISDTTFKTTIITKTPNTPNSIIGKNDPCFNTTENYFTPYDSLTDSYKWVFPKGWNILGNINSNNINVIVDSSSGFATVYAEKLGCSSSGFTSNLDVRFLPVKPIFTSGETHVRSNETKTYSVQNISNALTYNWSIPNDWAILSGSGTKQIIVLTGDSSGFVTVSASNTCGTGINQTMMVFSNIPNGISKIGSSFQPNLFPNPTSDILNFSLPENSEGKIEWNIYDLLGKKVLTGTETINNNISPILFQINISELKSSNFFLEIKTQNGVYYNKFHVIK